MKSYLFFPWQDGINDKDGINNKDDKDGALRFYMKELCLPEI